MNFFYGINTNFLRSEIQIPTFQNKNLKKTNLKLFKSYPENKRWVLQEVVKNKIHDYFYILKNDDISNKEIFFLADESIIDKFNYERLENFNNYTDTSPSFRANLKIYINQGGFSSYQSEYPYSMITKKGTIISPIASLSNSHADKNYISISH